MSQAKFRFYEIVRVLDSNPELAEIHGERGVILGRSAGSHDPLEYAVLILRDEHCWTLAEEDLETTDEFSSREEWYGEASIRVRVDEQGRGWAVD